MDTVETYHKRTDIFGAIGDYFFLLFEKINTKAYFSLIFLLQLILTLQGLDLSDEGFLIIFYRDIFSDPLSVSYNFMFWLTGIIGGLWLKLFSGLGLWGMRFAGALINVLTLIATYNLLKKYIKPGHLKMGLLFVILCLNNDPKILNYNTLSSLTFILLAGSLFKGLVENKTIYFFLTGILIALNTFIRIPNILELGLIVVILYYNWSKSYSFSRSLKQIIFFLLGFGICFMLILFTIKSLGHWEAFNNAMDFLFRMGNDQIKPNGVKENYGLENILIQFRSNFLRSIFFALLGIALILLFKATDMHLSTRNKALRIAVLILYYTLIILIITFIANGIIVNGTLNEFHILFFLSGIPLVTFIPFYIINNDKEFLLIYLIGLFFLLSFPVGSSAGIFSAGRFCLWIALPISIDFIMNLNAIKINLDLFYLTQKKNTEFIINKEQYYSAKSLLMLFILITGLIYIYFHPFFDWNSRSKMFYTVNNDKLNLIHTTKDRAHEIDVLMEASSKYCKENDYILVFDRIPMVYYATNTKSFLANPFPGVYRADLLKYDLNASLQRHGFLPVVIQQLIHTSGMGSRWPNKIMEDDFLKAENVDRNAVFNQFLEQNRYIEVWKNDYFRILTPGTQKQQQ